MDGLIHIAASIILLGMIYVVTLPLIGAVIGVFKRNKIIQEQQEVISTLTDDLQCLKKILEEDEGK